MDQIQFLHTQGQQAKEASYLMSQASLEQKNQVLDYLTLLLDQQQDWILEYNQQDVKEALKKGLSESLIDRLNLENRLKAMITDIDQVKKLPDPVGEQFDKQELPNGLSASKCRVPIGVLGVIYESRPNVTLDVATLAIKTGNCAILRGGSETLRTNRALVQLVQTALKNAHLPLNAIQFIDNSDRTLVHELLRLNQCVDLIIPRGGAHLHSFCREYSTIPVITGGIGICHLFVDETAQLEKALQVIINAKTQRPTVCNALDTLLVHQQIASTFIPQAIAKLQSMAVEFRVDQHVLNLMNNQTQVFSSLKLAQEQDWETEWLSLVLGIKIVKDLDEALAHIRLYSSGHSDGILTENREHANRFVKQIDSAAVYVNASTRFTDGSQLGLGAEVAISTQKLHARGPMGLKELTTYKWIIWGDYHTRA